MAEVLYYVVRLEVLSWKIAKHGSVSSILEILYVCQRKRGQWLARRIPNNVYGKWGGQSRGLMAPNSERVQASVPRYCKAINLCCQGETENEGAQARVLPQTGN